MALRKKIIHLVPTLERGGSEMSQLRMLPYLNDEIESIFITLKQEGSLAPKFREKDITVIAINQKGLWDFVSYVRLLKILRSLHPNLIVTHLLYADIVGRFLVQFFVTPPVIASLATTYNFPSYWPARLFERLTKYFTKGYIANAEIVKKTYVEKFGVPEKKITVLTTGMDTEALSSLVPDASLRQSLGIDAHDTVLISVANLHINKGHRYLLEAFEELYPTYPETKLLLVGDGLERENLENQVKNYQSKNAILFLGKRSDVPQLLALSHIFVLPTFFEGMCNAIMEAMARGLAVITTDIQENQELITHEKTGLLCPVKNTPRLKESIECLLTDPAYAQTLGEQAARHMKEKYALETTTKRWREYYLGSEEKKGELYEQTYQDPKHFSFGKNWKRFLQTLNNRKLQESENSLSAFLGGRKGVVGKTFVDIGSGSGLFSLAAYRLGAKHIVSVDIDEFSLSCTNHLRQSVGDPANWQVLRGSALDREFVRSLDTFDIVYSWGVLHHTGDMYQALENVKTLVNERGKLYLALYNDNPRFLEGTSSFWVKLKRFYNHRSWLGKKSIEGLYTLYYFLGLLANGKNPFTYIKNYHTLRGMNFWTDIKDWLGGYPYEFASTEKIIQLFKSRGFVCTNLIKARSIGCNEYLFEKKKS